MTPDSFQDCCLQPLGHASITLTILFKIILELSNYNKVKI